MTKVKAATVIGSRAPTGTVVVIRDVASGVSAFVWKEDDERHVAISPGTVDVAQLVAAAADLLGAHVSGVKIEKAQGVTRLIVSNLDESDT